MAGLSLLGRASRHIWLRSSGGRLGNCGKVEELEFVVVAAVVMVLGYVG